MKEYDEKIAVIINLDRQKKKGRRKCAICGTSWGLIRKYNLYICRRCMRDHGEKLGFRKYH